MFKQCFLRRSILAVTVACLTLPLLMGPGCPIQSGPPLPGDPGDGQTPGTDDQTKPPADDATGLLIETGPNRSATVGQPVTLCCLVRGGTGPYVVTWTPAESLIDADTLTPTFVPATAGQYEFTLAVSDSKGLSGSRSVKVNALDHAALASFKWDANFAGGGYQLVATFTKPVDKATAENVFNYRAVQTVVTEPPAGSSSSVLPIVEQVVTLPTKATLSANGLVATLLFSTRVLTPDTLFDISLSDGILGADGVAVEEVAGLPAIANADDTKAPTIATRRWATGKQVDDAETKMEKEIWDKTGVSEEVRYNYILEVVFSEAMEPTSTQVPAAYRIQEGDSRYTPLRAELAVDGKTLTLVFTSGPLSRNSKLDTGLLPTLDVNGRTLAMETEKAVSTNPDDKTAPGIVPDAVRFVEGVTDGYQLTIDFNEPMDRFAAENPAYYQLDGTTPSQAELATDGRRVTLTFAAGTFSTTDKLSIAGNSVKDINAVSLPAQTNLAVLPAEDEPVISGVPSLTWLPGDQAQGYQIWVVFPVAMDKTTVENPNNWRITGTDTRATAVVLSSQTLGDHVAGRTALVTFDIDSMSRWDTIDISMTGPMLNINSRTVEQVTLPIAPSSQDQQQPEVAKTQGSTPLPDGSVLPDGTSLVLWCDWDDSQSAGHAAYKVTIQFSEMLDGASAANPENYLLQGNSPTKVTLLDGSIVVLEFATITTPPAGTDALELLSIVRDINGMANTASAPLQILGGCDTEAPQVANVNWVSNPVSYQLSVKFSEAMDRTSAEFLSHWTMKDINGIEQLPTAAELDLEDPTRLLLSFGAGLFGASSELAFSGEVRDISGNAMTTAGGWPKPVAADPDDSASLRIVSATWGFDAWEGYVVLLQFSEPIDGNNQGQYLLDGVVAGLAEVHDGGCTATLMFPNEDDPRAFGRDARLTAGDIKDLSSAASATDVRVVQPNPQEEFDPAYPFASTGPWVDYVLWLSDPLVPPYQIAVVFSEVVDKISAENVSNYQVTGTFIKPESAEVDPLFGVAVILTFSADSMPNGFNWWDTLDVSVGNSIYDVSGIPSLQSTNSIQ